MLKQWERFYDYVILKYDDGRMLVVSWDDFNRCTGAICSAIYEAVRRDFAVGGC